jgi:hypothetical protein
MGKSKYYVIFFSYKMNVHPKEDSHETNWTRKERKKNSIFSWLSHHMTGIKGTSLRRRHPSQWLTFSNDCHWESSWEKEKQNVEEIMLEGNLLPSFRLRPLQFPGTQTRKTVTRTRKTFREFVNYKVMERTLMKYKIIYLFIFIREVSKSDLFNLHNWVYTRTQLHPFFLRFSKYH